MADNVHRRTFLRYAAAGSIVAAAGLALRRNQQEAIAQTPIPRTGGPWLKTRVEAGDFFLTASQSPYEVRWRAIGSEPFETMHVYLGLPVFNRAIEEAFQTDQGATHLRDLSGFKDNFLSALLEGLHKELLSRYRGSSQFVEGIAQSLAGHLVRTYADETTQEYKGGLPGFRLRKVRDLMVTHLQDEFSLIRLARGADMSEFHFSRAFKKTAGLTPSRAHDAGSARGAGGFHVLYGHPGQRFWTVDRRKYVSVQAFAHGRWG